MPKIMFKYGNTVIGLSENMFLRDEDIDRFNDTGKGCLTIDGVKYHVHSVRRVKDRIFELGTSTYKVVIDTEEKPELFNQLMMLADTKE